MSRFEWFLGILLVLLLVVVAVLARRMWLPPANVETAETAVSTDPEAIPTPVLAGQTAQTAFALAQEAAAAWQPDATLVSATATWPTDTPTAVILDGETSWGFTFYAPEAHETAVFTVVEETAQLISSGLYRQSQPPALVAATNWQVDSPQVIAQFMAPKGNDFVNTAATSTFTMALDGQSENGRLVWLLTLLDTENGRSLTMRFDANSGEQLEEITAP